MWRATCIQMPGDLATLAGNRVEAWDTIGRNVEHAVAMIRECCTGDTPPRLVVLPEFAFQGAPLGAAVSDWIEKVCCPIPGAITAPLQTLAREFGIFIGGNQFESTDEWPGRYFNTSFLINPQGEIVLRYRRVTTAAFPSPHDFMDAYLAATPEDEVFPVVETELGRLAMIPCSEIAVPEVARVFMLKGAEVILHPTNSRDDHTEDAAKVARCAENKAYLISANIAGPIGFSPDRSLMGGRSRILDFEGRVLASDPGHAASVSVSAEIDIGALRRNRLEDTGPSSLLRSRWEMYRPYFASASIYPPNQFLVRPMMHVDETAAALNQARENLPKG